MKKFYLTTPIYYVNDKPHIGHAYTTIAADVIARYYRAKNKPVMFLTGTDEHGKKVAEAAEKNKTTPQQFVDDISGHFKSAWQKLNISNDYFIRTTDVNHVQVVNKVLRQLFKAGLIYKSNYEGLYCVSCEEFKTDKDLVDGLCAIHKTKPEKIKEECYFLKVSKYQSQLQELITKGDLEISPQTRKNEIISFLKNEKLTDVAISRQKEKVDWGISLPFDKNYTTYVWVDALLNYLTATNWPDKDFDQVWPPDLQLMAKDILRIHSTVWPAIILGLGLKLPKKIFAHGFFTINGHKMSKSLNNVVDPVKLADEYGADVVRYFLLREFTFGHDGDFNLERFAERYNADLANDLGNLVQRILSLAKNNQIQTIPDKTKTLTEVEKDLENLKFKDALDRIWEFVVTANQEIELAEPWKLAKTEPVKFAKFIGEMVVKISLIANSLAPFMPKTSAQILKQIKTQEIEPIFPIF